MLFRRHDCFDFAASGIAKLQSSVNFHTHGFALARSKPEITMSLESALGTLSFDVLLRNLRISHN
jgi:hypothetical protein